jgi:hypothetical protein
MTKLEELKAARDAAYEAWSACDATWADRDAARDASAAYQAELNKTQEENSDDI